MLGLQRTNPVMGTVFLMVYMKSQCIGIEILIFVNWDNSYLYGGVHILNQCLE